MSAVLLTAPDRPAPAEAFGLKAWGLWLLTQKGLAVPTAWAVLPGVHPPWPGDTLVSVRSSPRVSSPGGFPTLLWVGLTRAGVPALARRVGAAAAWRAWLGHLVQWQQVVAGRPGHAEAVRSRDALARGRTWHHLEPAALEALADALEPTLAAPVPPVEQQQARALEHVTASGCAAVVQWMVHADGQGACGAGAANSRHPSLGTPGPVGGFLASFPGPVLMRGERTPAPLRGTSHRGVTLEGASAAAWAALSAGMAALERALGVPAEVEFALEDGALWWLQVRPARLEPRAALRSAVDRVAEGALTREDALVGLASLHAEGLLQWRVQPGPTEVPLARGVVACTGAVGGLAVFNAAEALELRARGGAPILIRPECNPEDRAGLAACEGVFASRGGTTSHAAVMSRALQKPCVVGGHALMVDTREGTATAPDGRTLRTHDPVTLDAHQGALFAGDLPRLPAPAIPELATVLGWATERWTQQDARVPLVVLDRGPQSAALAAMLGIPCVQNAPEAWHAPPGLPAVLPPPAGLRVACEPADALAWLLALAGTPGAPAR